jgi:hypothetical protein
MQAVKIMQTCSQIIQTVSSHNHAVKSCRQSKSYRQSHHACSLITHACTPPSDLHSMHSSRLLVRRLSRSAAIDSTARGSRRVLRQRMHVDTHRLVRVEVVSSRCRDRRVKRLPAESRQWAAPCCSAVRDQLHDAHSTTTAPHSPRLERRSG